MLVSLYVDVEEGITACRWSDIGVGFMRGTFDNAITNAANVHLMLEGGLPDDVVVAFTVDEESDLRGARQVAGCLGGCGRVPRVTVVLDATDVGWAEDVDYTIENDFWGDSESRLMVPLLARLPGTWRFIPWDPGRIPAGVDASHAVPMAAGCDESCFVKQN